VIRGVFVTGTDTGVGKTRVAAGLLRRLRAAGLDATAMKPIQTGAARDRDGRLLAPDLVDVLSAAGLEAGEAEREELAPYVFEPACAPHLAARLLGREIELPRIVACARRVAARHDAIVVEGAGGVLVPLGRGATMADLAAALGVPAVLVAHAGLGTLNHVFLSLEALRARRVRVAGVVLNDARAADEGTRWIREDNARTIAELGAAPVLAHVPFLGATPDPGALDAAFAALDVRALLGGADDATLAPGALRS
jgi:dethiobiotin synthetase